MHVWGHTAGPSIIRGHQMREKLSGSKQIIAPSERERKRNAGKGSGFEGKTEKGKDALLLLLHPSAATFESPPSACLFPPLSTPRLMQNNTYARFLVVFDHYLICWCQALTCTSGLLQTWIKQQHAQYLNSQQKITLIQQHGLSIVSFSLFSQFYLIQVR